MNLERKAELLALQADGKVRNLKINAKIQTAIGWTDPVTGERHRAQFHIADFIYEQLECVKCTDRNGIKYEDEWLPFVENEKGRIVWNLDLCHTYSA